MVNVRLQARAARGVSICKPLFGKHTCPKSDVMIVGWFPPEADVRQSEPSPLIKQSTVAYSRNRSRGWQGSPVRSPHTRKPYTRKSFRESSSGPVKFIVYQMTHEFRRLFGLGFGDADSAQDRKEQRALYWLYWRTQRPFLS